MPRETPAGHAATVIIGEKVRPGCEEAFLAWQHGLNSMASRYPGFIAAEIDPPAHPRAHWSLIYRFDSIPNLRAWINSATRQDSLAEGRRYLDGPPTQQIVTGAAAPPDTLVTAMVTHRVLPDQIDEFLAWQERLRCAENRFPGFRGSEIFRPIEGVQDEWTMLYRYDSAADLDRWLTSTERQRLLDEGKRFSDFHLRTIDNSFGSWFAFEDVDPAHPPSQTKTSIAVWVGLYPTVVLLSLAMAPAGLPLWLGMLVGNLLSSFVMTFVTMPRYVNPLLARWLQPAPGSARKAIEIRGAVLIAAVMTFWTLLFWLVTSVFWHLP
ncbi:MULTISPECIES: antibiotic biosynthesis monooxygenase [Nocardia]|uniref:Antibiotic biosynthesis monooxygenase n=2 Tax=Nocardia TaxID=1817 RepID=A0A2T2YY43_9NOCA|nr:MULTISPECIES: antibiotic biosynthesis monooxygenase [Nocardia]MBF6447283.1 antibiotic biosynthesis monooxygenase [Nocardia elegans]PSR60424.1 antibiotic biosynthesis monooxygenase [Nocardia nova]